MPRPNLLHAAQKAGNFYPSKHFCSMFCPPVSLFNVVFSCTHAHTYIYIFNFFFFLRNYRRQRGLSLGFFCEWVRSYTVPLFWESIRFCVLEHRVPYGISSCRSWQNHTPNKNISHLETEIHDCKHFVKIGLGCGTSQRMAIVTMAFIVFLFLY